MISSTILKNTKRQNNNNNIIKQKIKIKIQIQTSRNRVTHLLFTKKWHRISKKILVKTINAVQLMLMIL